MNNYLTVPAAPRDSPTMCRARLASGKHIYLSQHAISTHVKQKQNVHRVTDGAHRDQILCFVWLTMQSSQNDRGCRKHYCFIYSCSSG